MKHLKLYNEGIITNVKNRVKNFKKFGQQRIDQTEKLIGLLAKLAHKNDNVKLIENGVIIKSPVSGDIYTVYKNGKVVMPMGSTVYVDTDEAEKLYNDILKNSFEQ